MMKKKICLRMFSPHIHYNLLDFEKFLVEYSETVKSAPPQYWNLYEPINKPFTSNFSAVSHSEELGDLPLRFEKLYWERRKKPKMEGSYRPARNYDAGTIHMSFEITSDIVPESVLYEFIDYLKKAIIHCSADFAYMDLLNERQAEVYYDSDFIFFSDKKRTDGYLSLVTHQLRHWLPDLCWLTFFGKPYVELFGEEKLATAPVYKVEKIGDIGYLLQVTENIFDIDTDFDAYREKVEAVKQHLNRNAFYIKEKAYDLDSFFSKVPVPEPGTVFDAPVFKELEAAFAAENSKTP